MARMFSSKAFVQGLVIFFVKSCLEKFILDFVLP